MKTRIVSLLAAVSISLVLAGPAFAHHSMSMYDRGHDTTLKATITAFKWENPHSHILFTVTDEQGNTVQWDAEGGSPHRLTDRGWSKDSLKPGEQVTIIGNRNKNGSPTMRFEQVIFPDGQALGTRRHHIF
ncbi:MAG TPA: DUF6152 family protein [Candidatus Dormibacteraeota bacterium]|nr:DUF6152 family protein [Candidatus Dormibacteraeota bacterium]